MSASESLIARVAGNILSGCRHVWDMNPDVDDAEAEDLACVRQAVKLARLIVEEVQRTAPPGDLASPVSEPPPPPVNQRRRWP